LNRILYLLAMYSGVRAVFNQVRSFFLPRPRASTIDGETLRFEGFDRAKIRVHARAPPKSLGSRQIAGMISIYSVTPGIPRFFYAMLRLTSHFGCGHIEIAFSEEKEMVTFFAIRNILRSNIDRLGCSRLFCNLKLSNDNDEIVVLRIIIQLLNAQDIDTSFASPEDCVSLAVNESLLIPETRNRTIEAMKRRYRRVAGKSAIHAKPDIRAETNGRSTVLAR
jgi:hypothetical protein